MVRFLEFFGGRVDTIMQRILEVIASIPNLIVVILFVLIFEPSIYNYIGYVYHRLVRHEAEFLDVGIIFKIKKSRVCHGFENIGGFKIQIDI